MSLTADTNVSTILQAMEDGGGFSAKHLGQATDIMTGMLKEENCFKFLSFPSCLVATGVRGVIKDMVKEKMFDAIVTTAGTASLDMIRCVKEHYHGDFNLDDEQLYKDGVYRLGNVLIPEGSYGEVVEKIMQPVLEELWEGGMREMSSKELLWEFGKRLDDASSILTWAYRNQIPVFVPGLTDGAFGSQLWLFYQKHPEFRLHLFADETDLSDIVWKAEKTGALMIGGGISKHHVIWWNMFRDGLDYAVYITTAVEHDGSLSGARVREAVSWGKVAAQARYVTVPGDATALLPFLYVGVLKRMK